MFLSPQGSKAGDTLLQWKYNDFVMVQFLLIRVMKQKAVTTDFHRQIPTTKMQDE